MTTGSHEGCASCAIISVDHQQCFCPAVPAMELICALAADVSLSFTPLGESGATQSGQLA